MVLNTNFYQFFSERNGVSFFPVRCPLLSYPQKCQKTFSEIFVVFRAFLYSFRLLLVHLFRIQKKLNLVGKADKESELKRLSDFNMNRNMDISN